MANRELARANDATPEIGEDGIERNVGMWEEVTIERSAAGAPGLMFVMSRYDNDQLHGQMVVTVKDGDEFLRPVFEWLGMSGSTPPDPTRNSPSNRSLGRIEAAQRQAEKWADKHRDEGGFTTDAGGIMLQLVSIIEELKEGIA